MAGHASNWFKATAGPLKGQSVYVQREGKPREAVLAALNAGASGTVSRATSRPKGVARRAGEPIGTTAYGFRLYGKADTPRIQRDSPPPILIVMSGMPGSGKSAIRERMTKGQDGWETVDPDDIKKNLPNYDPKNPQATHAQSVVEAAVQLDEGIKAGRDMIWDQTGANPMTPEVIAQAKALGYRVKVVAVEVSIEVARTRNARRDRVVSQETFDWYIDNLPKRLKVAGNTPGVDDKFAVDNN